MLFVEDDLLNEMIAHHAHINGLRSGYYRQLNDGRASVRKDKV